MLRGGRAITRTIIVGVCAAAAGYAAGETIAPTNSAAELPGVSVPQAPTVSVPQTPAVSVPAPTVSVPQTPTVPSLPVSTPTPPPVTVPIPSGGGEPPAAHTPTGSSAPPSGRLDSPSSPSTSAPARHDPSAPRRPGTGSPNRHHSGATRSGRVHSGPRAPLTRRRARATLGRAPAALSSRAPVTAGGRARRRAKHSSNPLDTIGRQLPLPLPIPDWSKPIIAVLLLVAIVFAARSRLAARRAGRLEQRGELLLEDVEAMQLALVPAVPGRLEGLAVSAAYFAADGPAAGGDFYDVFVLSAGKVAIMLGDACGHGRDALARAALTRYTLRAYLQAGLEPRAALRLAGRTLVDRQSFQFATAVLALYDSQSGTLTYATAAHPAPIIHGPGAPEPPSAFPSTPIGWGLPTGRAQTKVSLPPRSAACFFSDGLTDARQPGGALFGRGRLVEILRSLGQRPAAAELLERVRAQADASRDDMAACVIAPEAARAAPADGAFAHVEELEADGGELSGTDVGSFLQTCAITPAETAEALEKARDIASRFETALLTVHCTPAGATVVATPPEVQTHEVTIRPPADL